MDAINILNTPSIPIPEPDTVHLWHINLRQPNEVITQLTQVLSANEMQRVKRFVHLADRQASIVSKGSLRSILAQYLNMTAMAITFCQSTTGKPYLQPSLTKQHLTFNISHSHDRAVIAVANNQAVGVDIEYEKRHHNFRAIIKRYFSNSEAAHLLSLSEQTLQSKFVQCWTVKEAIVKASGDGLAVALSQIETLACLQQNSFLAVDHINKEWAVNTWQPATAYRAAIATERVTKNFAKYQVLFNNRS